MFRHMKRTIALAIAALMFGLAGIATPASAAPDRPDVPTHSVSAGYTLNQCIWGRAYFGEQGRTIYAFRTIHYGTTHVTQCAVRNGIVTCYQYIWSTNTWDHYIPPSTRYPFCWG